MDFATKTKFVDALLACPAMRDRNTRNAIVDQLTVVRGRIPRSETERTDVASIVNRLLDYTGGFDQLIEVLRFYEGDSRHIQRIDTLCNEYRTTMKYLPYGDDILDRGHIKSLFSRLIYSALICCTLLNFLLSCFIIISIDVVNLTSKLDPELNVTITETPTTISPSPLPSPTLTGKNYVLRLQVFLGNNISSFECDKQISKTIKPHIDKLQDVQFSIDCDDRLDGNEGNKTNQLVVFYNAKSTILTEEANNDSRDKTVMEISINADQISVTETKPPNPEFINEILPTELMFLTLLSLTQSEYDRSEFSNAAHLFKLAGDAIPKNKTGRLDGAYCDFNRLLSDMNETDTRIDIFLEFCSE